MAYHQKIVSLKTIEHLDPNSQLHSEHVSWSLISRIKKLSRRVLNGEGIFAQRHTFKSLGKGFSISRDGRILDGEQHEAIRTKVTSERGRYKSTVQRPGGAVKERFRRTDPLRSLPVTTRPDQHNALVKLDGLEDQRSWIRMMFIELGIELIKTFELITPYEVIGVPIHADESVLHFHLDYSTVNENLELLHSNRRRGRNGPPTMGPLNLGALRLQEAGLVSEGEYPTARADYNRIMKRSGEEPVDWVLAKTVDAFWETKAEINPTLKKLLEDERAVYIEKRQNEFYEPEEVHSRVEKLEEENKGLRADLERIMRIESNLEKPLNPRVENLEMENECLRADLERIKRMKSNLEKPLKLRIKLSLNTSSKSIRNGS